MCTCSGNVIHPIFSSQFLSSIIVLVPFWPHPWHFRTLFMSFKHRMRKLLWNFNGKFFFLHKFVCCKIFLCWTFKEAVSVHPRKTHFVRIWISQVFLGLPSLARRRKTVRKAKRGKVFMNDLCKPLEQRQENKAMLKGKENKYFRSPDQTGKIFRKMGKKGKVLWT